MRDDDEDVFGYHEADSGTRWFIGIIVSLALLSIGYLVFSANNCHSDVCITTIEATE